jgi:hypothetical protein
VSGSGEPFTSASLQALPARNDYPWSNALVMPPCLKKRILNFDTQLRIPPHNVLSGWSPQDL